MTGEFRIAKGWRIFLYIFSPLLIAAFIFLGIMPFVFKDFNWTIVLILIPISVGGIILFTYALVDTIVTRIIITADSISQKTARGTKTLRLEEIKGFRIDKYTRIEPKEVSEKGIQISMYVEQYNDIVIWLSENFTDLDTHDATEDRKQILDNDEFGISIEARQARLNEARVVARCINIGGYVLFAWLIFFPRPYLISVSVGMIFPIIALLVLYFYRGLIRLNEEKNSGYPSIVYGFFVPAMSVLLRALFDYEIMDYSNVWIVTGLFAVVLTTLTLSVTKEIKFQKLKDYFMAVLICLFVFCYCVGTYLISNCLFDKSEAQTFHSKVIDKESSSGKTTSYYLKLEPWGPRTEAENVEVGRDQYRSTNIGDDVTVHLHEGLLKTPWFYVTAED